MQREGPFRITRDVIRDNITVTRKIRLKRGAQIHAQSIYATGVGNGTVNMPFNGKLNLTVSSGAVGNTIGILNPFITSSSTVVLATKPAGASASTIAITNPGIATITLGGTVVGTYVVSVTN